MIELEVEGVLRVTVHENRYIPHPDHHTWPQFHGCDALVADLNPVTAIEVLDQEHAISLDDPGVISGDGVVLDTDLAARRAPDQHRSRAHLQKPISARIPESEHQWGSSGESHGFAFLARW